ncbi:MULTISPECIES: hypothetical protein [unclassified Streptomyces]|uniref:hypothetical protein n=1 Tax=unclassified Streptomyces TaxID=2593676 RepID=UPI00099BC541|nr:MULTISPECIES: hypothetical protein [unclassified Streptomyces]
MIDVLTALAAGALVTWLIRRKVRQRAEDAGRGDEIGVPCMLRHPAREGRWLRGRMLIGPAGMTWEAGSRAGAAVSLPAELRRVGLRVPSLREAITINGGSRIVECASPEGTVLIAVMPYEVEHVLKALDAPRAE